MSDITHDVPDILVTILPDVQYVTDVTPSEIYQVNVTAGDIYSVDINNPNVIVTDGSSSVYDTAQLAGYAFYAGTSSLALTASYNASSSYATSASFASKSISASFAQKSINANTANTASYALFALSVAASASSVYTNLSASNDLFVGNNLTVGTSATIPSITGSVTEAITSSYAVTASYVSGAIVGWDDVINKPTGIVSSSVQTVEYINNQVITPSSVTASIQSTQIQVKSDTSNVYLSSSVVTGVYAETRIIYPPISVTEFSGASIEYTAQRTSDVRSGMIISSWNNSDITYTDVSNTDIGNTQDLSFNFVRTDGVILLRAVSAGSGVGNWTIQFLFKLFPNLL